jgi:hypothetical protein
MLGDYKGFHDSLFVRQTPLLNGGVFSVMEEAT